MSCKAFLAMLSLLSLIVTSPVRAGTMIGIHQGLQGDLNYGSELQTLEGQIGRPAVIDAQNDDWATFPNTSRIQWDMQTGHIPMETWFIAFDITNPNACATATAIMAGTYDTLLARQAATLKSLGGTILVRWNPEMTNNAENTCFTGFPIANNLPLAGQRFIGAWRHIVGRFRAAGATNVQWIFGPGAGAFWQNIWGYFYPGSAYVDWIGMDDYNIVDTPASFATDPGVPQFYPEVSSLGKHVMISDTGAFEDPTMNPDPMTTWVNTSRSYLKSFQGIDAYIWWNAFNPVSSPPPPYSGTGWVLHGQGLAAFKSMVNDPYFTITWAQWLQTHPQSPR